MTELSDGQLRFIGLASLLDRHAVLLMFHA